jgi:6-phosphogluconate dehydrogenase
MIGLGRMGGNMARRLTKGGHQCVVLDDPKGAAKTTSPKEFDLAFFSRVEIASVFKVGN